jgi:DNA polymerase III epsilon subunit-like protein
LSIISDLRPFVLRRDLLPSANGGVGRLKFSRYGPSNLTLSDCVWICSHACHEEDCPHNICLSYYVLDNCDSYSQLSNDVNQAVLTCVDTLADGD